MSLVGKASDAEVLNLDMVISIAPISLPRPGRGADLQVRLSAPLHGNSLAIIIFSHGNGQSHHGYGPLINHWASQGFVVIQPTHLDSRSLGLPPDDPRRPDFWQHREQHLLRVLDELDRIERATPAIQGRLDRTRVSVAEHSWGAVPRPPARCSVQSIPIRETDRWSPERSLASRRACFSQHQEAAVRA
jgi:predicted dienelactone hydrolase